MMKWGFGHKSDVSQTLTNDYENEKHYRFEVKKKKKKKFRKLIIYCSIVNVPAKNWKQILKCTFFSEAGLHRHNKIKH